jgi:tetratricopeptide (TPR) repeat protein
MHARDTLLRSDESWVISPAQLEIGRIRELTRERRHAEALTAAEALAVTAPENGEVLYLVAANQRCLQRIPEALATLERLEQQHPRLARLYQERGHCYMTLRDAPRAIEAFLRGVSINPALTASWSMLERLYRMSGDTTNAALAAEQRATLERLPREVVQAGSLFSDGELTRAEHIVRAYLREAPHHVEAMRLLARITHQRAVFDEAESLLEGVLKLAPDYRAARLDYARVLVDRQQYPRARAEIDALLKLEPDNQDYRALQADLHLLVAHSLKTRGRRQAAIESYRAAAAARPGFGDAYWSLANLKTYRFSQEEIAHMRAHEAAVATAPLDRCHLCFALGKALEDRGEFAESWQYYERGNLLKRKESHYRPEIIETNTQRQIEVCTAEFFAARVGVGALDPDPIFIVGLPRSGSTLIEQILASHSQVEGTQELPEIQHIVRELEGGDPDPDDPRYPGVLGGLTPEEFRRLGERYMKDTGVYRGAARDTTQPVAPRAEAPPPFFIDKMPNNFRHVGLIHLILPNAKIIDARREPLACCCSNLKQLFASGQEFTYGIETVARYYLTYLDLMRHWDAVLPGKVLRLQYEDLVEDLEGHVRRILTFCGLEFEPACLEFHKTERSIRTASSEQVRQPLFRDGLDQWRHYEPWLGPLSNALGDALLRYRE